MDSVQPLLAVGAPLLVTQLAIVLIGAAVIGYVCHRIGLIPIVGYLLVGVVTGPNALGLVEDADLVEQAGEIGVIFLLFAIGLELSGDQLRRMGSLLLGRLAPGRADGGGDHGDRSVLRRTGQSRHLQRLSGRTELDRGRVKAPL